MVELFLKLTNMSSCFPYNDFSTRSQVSPFPTEWIEKELIRTILNQSLKTILDSNYFNHDFCRRNIEWKMLVLKNFTDNSSINEKVHWNLLGNNAHEKSTRKREWRERELQIYICIKEESNRKRQREKKRQKGDQKNPVLSSVFFLHFNV